MFVSGYESRRIFVVFSSTVCSWTKVQQLLEVPLLEGFVFPNCLFSPKPSQPCAVNQS